MVYLTLRLLRHQSKKIKQLQNIELALNLTFTGDEFIFVKLTHANSSSLLNPFNYVWETIYRISTLLLGFGVEIFFIIYFVKLELFWCVYVYV